LPVALVALDTKKLTLGPDGDVGVFSSLHPTQPNTRTARKEKHRVIGFSSHVMTVWRNAAVGA
jgi:hypothetical protein